VNSSTQEALGRSLGHVRRGPAAWIRALGELGRRRSQKQSIGEVELLQREKIVGWARERGKTTPATVEVWLGGRKLRTIRADRVRRPAANHPGGEIGFRFRIHGTLWRYVHERSAISFRVAGEELPIRLNRLKLASPAHRKPVESLFEKLDNGYIVTKKGAVKVSISESADWQEAVLDWYAVAGEKFRSLFGYDLYIVYGTLLGLVRENGFIPGDDDFDTAYLSKHTDPKKVRAEMAAMIRRLRESGECIRVGRRRNLFHWKSPQGIEIDVFPSWLRDEKYFLSFAVAADCADSIRKGFATRSMAGKTVLAPVEAETVLAASYGPNWRKPDPLFQWIIPPAARSEMRRVKLSRRQVELLRAPKPKAETEAPA